MSLTTETARDILLDAFDDINVRRDVDTLTATDVRIGIKAINRIMATLNLNGATITFTNIVNISDVMSLPDGAIDALISVVAYRLWPKYRKVEPQGAILSNALAGIRALYKLGKTITTTEYPCTLPTGSGNANNYITNDNFYPGIELLNEIAGA